VILHRNSRSSLFPVPPEGKKEKGEGKGEELRGRGFSHKLTHVSKNSYLNMDFPRAPAKRGNVKRRERGGGGVPVA